MHSLNRRLILSAGVWITLVLIVGGIALSFVFQRAVDDSFNRRLDGAVNALIAATNIDPDQQITITRSLGDARFEQALSGWYWQISSGEIPLARSRSLWDESMPHTVSLEQTGEFGLMTLRGPRNRILWASYRTLQVDGFENPVRFMVAGDTSDLMAERRNFDIILGVSLLTLGLGVLMALVIQVRFGLRPLRGLVRDLETIRQRKAVKLHADYPDEIRPLIRVTNLLLEENQNRIERARRHVGNLAHALKTPLTLLRSVVGDNHSPEKLSLMSEQIAVITKLVEHHLARAAAAGTSSFTSMSVPLYDTIEPIIQSLKKIYAVENRRVHMDIPTGLVFRGEREDLEEIFGNILENAFKWAHHTINVSAQMEQDGLYLCVSDDGPGMADEQVKTAVMRGQRLDEMIPGHGLGLSIVSDLVALYQGELVLAQAPNGGLSVTVKFPPERTG